MAANARTIQTGLLIGLLIVIHAQLWIGRGSLSEVAQMAAALRAQTLQNQQARLVNQQLAAEVHDLQNGLEMVEEKARQELGMVKPNEVLVQIIK